MVRKRTIVNAEKISAWARNLSRWRVFGIGIGMSHPRGPSARDGLTQKESPMSLPSLGRSLAAIAFLLAIAGCNNTLNPLCGSARPAPLIGSLSPSTVGFSQVQDGFLLTVNGSQFVSSSQAVVNGQPLSATVVSPTQLNVMLTTGVISGPGAVNVSVKTPSGNSGDVGCTSGGNSSVLVLTVN